MNTHRNEAPQAIKNPAERIFWALQLDSSDGTEATLPSGATSDTTSPRGSHHPQR
ncbi:hypothetical protein [Leptolyngbya sp. FACHB-261]|uniref:hypothetical protein n=1 Tax=Leptolyngbya sp. FACHB-261 TaxID=2692806 RepID=UPI00168620F6|nr:hypothetical protein [Leptolyngbya sp. FACHB-261]